MGSSTNSGSLAPHPGWIVYRTMWNHTEIVKSISEVPEMNRFVYYDAEHMETADLARATQRIPILEVEMSSYDAEGKLVDPAKSVRISVAEFGPNHRELRHTSGSLPPRH